MQTIPLCVREGRPGWWGQRKAVLRDRELPDNSQTLRLGVGPVASPAYDTKCLFLRVSTTCSGSTFQVPATFLSPTLSCSQNLACAQLTFPLHHLLGHLFPIPSAFIQHAAVSMKTGLYPACSFLIALNCVTHTLSQIPGLCLGMSLKLTVAPGKGVFVTEKCFMLYSIQHC